jgi:hypothetical protein
MSDLLRFAAALPSIPVQRRMDLGAVVEARARLADRPGWPAIFIKGYALVCRDVPALRRAFVRLPWPHLVEYPASVAGVAVEREYGGEPAVFFGRIKDPAALPVGEIHAHIRGFADRPVRVIRSFREMLLVGALPSPVRRAAMWLGLNLPRLRSHHFGTFGLTAYSALGAESLHPISPLTTTLTYGPIDAAGRVDTRLVYDHRVLDGATVARALSRLEAALTGPVLAELTAATPASRAA